MYSGITSGRVLNGELLYTKILEVNLFAFAYRLFRRDFSTLDGRHMDTKRQKHKLLTKVENHRQRKGLSALREKLWPL